MLLTLELGLGPGEPLGGGGAVRGVRREERHGTTLLRRRSRSRFCAKLESVGTANIKIVYGTTKQECAKWCQLNDNATSWHRLMLSSPLQLLAACCSASAGIPRIQHVHTHYHGMITRKAPKAKHHTNKCDTCACAGAQNMQVMQDLISSATRQVGKTCVSVGLCFLARSCASIHPCCTLYHMQASEPK
jgi:hypothetical protein